MDVYRGQENLMTGKTGDNKFRGTVPENVQDYVYTYVYFHHLFLCFYPYLPMPALPPFFFFAGYAAPFLSFYLKPTFWGHPTTQNNPKYGKTQSGPDSSPWTTWWGARFRHGLQSFLLVKKRSQENAARKAVEPGGRRLVWILARNSKCRHVEGIRWDLSVQKK